MALVMYITDTSAIFLDPDFGFWGMMMDFIDVLRSRRSVRSFTDSTLDHGEIQCLLESATLAPSANDVQPWEFGSSKVGNGSAPSQIERRSG